MLMAYGKIPHRNKSPKMLFTYQAASQGFADSKEVLRLLS